MLPLAHRLRRTPLRDWPTLELSVAEAAAVWVAAFLASAALGIVRQVLLNARFGLGAEAAAYYAASRLPETVAVLVAGGALSNALIPVLLRAERDSGTPRAVRAVNLALTALLAAFAPLCVAAAIAAPTLVRVVLAPGLDPTTQQLTADLARIMLLEVLLTIAEAAVVALLIARNQVLLPALAVALRNVTVLGGIGVSFAVPQVGIYGPTVGSILDVLIQLLVLTPGLRRRGYRPQVTWAPWDRDLRATGRLLAPSAVSGLANYGGAVVDTAFASFAGPAAVGALVNASLLIGLPTRLLGIAIGQALLPRAAALSLHGDAATARALLRRTLLIACTLAILAALALIVLSRPAIALVFQRGAFDAAAVALTYQLLVVYALGLPAAVATEVATRALLARADARTPMLTNLGQLGLRAALCAVLISPLGPVAIPAALVISATLEAAALLLVLFRSPATRL